MYRRSGYGRAIALGLLVASVVVVTRASALTLIASPELLAIDLRAYVGGATRLLETGSPYAPELMDGPIEHTVSNVPIAYLYPPPIAQMFVPLLWLPTQALATLWTIGQGLTLAALLLVVFRTYGGSSSLAATGVIALVALGFAPFHWATFIGNVSGWLATAAAIVLIAQPNASVLAAVLAAVVKIAPLGFLLGSVVVPTMRWRSITTSLAVLGLSVVLGWTAWRAFVEVLPSLASMPPAVGPYNISPGQLLIGGPLEEYAGSLRVTLAVTFATLLVWRARGDHRLGWAAAATGLYLCATATSWLHYAVILLPVGVAAWPSASTALRAAMLALFACYGPLWTFGADGYLPLIATPLWIIALLWICLADRRLPPNSIVRP